MALSLEAIEAEITKAVNGPTTPQNIRDFALLCVARDNLLLILHPEERKQTPATLEEIEDALKNISCSSVDEIQRKKDAMTWTRIMRGE